MKAWLRPTIGNAPPRRLCHARTSLLFGFVALAMMLGPLAALAQVQHPLPVAQGKRQAAHAGAPVARQLIPPAPARLSAPPAPRPALSLETRLLPIRPAPAATAAVKTSELE